MNPRTRRLRRQRREGARIDRDLRALLGPDWTLIAPFCAFDWIAAHRFPERQRPRVLVLWCRRAQTEVRRCSR